MNVSVVIAAAVLAWGSHAVAQEQPPIAIAGGVFTTEQAQWGEREDRARCSRCHGRDLRAMYAEVPSLALIPFAVNWTDRSVGELFDTIRYTMPMIARQTMPRGRTDQKEFLDPVLSAALTAYILSFNGFPAGAAELPADTDYLSRITITEPVLPKF